MRWTIIRPPLVYGPGVKGSFHLLAKAVRVGLPLPLGSLTQNNRDMIGVANLSHFIRLCLTNPAAADQVFVVRDGHSLSTRGLVNALASAAGRHARMLPMPAVLLNVAGKMCGTGAMVERLTSSYKIDDSKARSRLGWEAPHAIDYDFTRLMRALV